MFESSGQKKHTGPAQPVRPAVPRAPNRCYHFPQGYDTLKARPGGPAETGLRNTGTNDPGKTGDGMNTNHEINTLRFLGVDMVNRAKSGHPGIVLGAAPTLHTLFTRHLSYDPDRPDWPDRDRFILSAGHGSALLYAMLHLAGYDVSMEDLKAFRQWGSRTPGHPEYGHTAGVEATTGPLGQGLAMAAGMAVAERYLARLLNRPELPLMDHHTYVLCGDGDLQEGVAQEAISLAGHLGLGKLIVLYDSNDIQLDGPVAWANSEDTGAKMESMHWQYLRVPDGEDTGAIDDAIRQARDTGDRPTLIEIKTVIGYGCPQAGTAETHGAPIGEEAAQATREALCYPHPPFEVDESVTRGIREKNGEKGIRRHLCWQERAATARERYPEVAAVLDLLGGNGATPLDWEHICREYAPPEKEATRASSGRLLRILQEADPRMIGGSADLTKSTQVKGIGGDFGPDRPAGRNINFGVREHAMGAMVNGMCLHGLRAFAGGFFIFSDYMKPAIRLSALMQIPSLFVFTHDSVAVGEDGPTHQPVEQLTGLRALPNLDVFRPADAREVAGAWKAALGSLRTPAALVLTRQGVPLLPGSDMEAVARGAYVIGRENERIDLLLLASGSEVHLALGVQELLAGEGIDTRVVSVPCLERFGAQDPGYQEEVLPAVAACRMALEMGTTMGWGDWVGPGGCVLGIDRFGASAPGGEVVRQYGFDAAQAADAARACLEKSRAGR